MRYGIVLGCAPSILVYARRIIRSFSVSDSFIFATFAGSALLGRAAIIVVFYGIRLYYVERIS